MQKRFVATAFSFKWKNVKRKNITLKSYTITVIVYTFLCFFLIIKQSRAGGHRNKLNKLNKWLNVRFYNVTLCYRIE